MERNNKIKVSDNQLAENDICEHKSKAIRQKPRNTIKLKSFVFLGLCLTFAFMIYTYKKPKE